MAKSLQLLLLFFVCCLQNCCHVTQAANILAVFPSVWKSHYLYGRRLMQQLVTHGNHSVTLISPYGSSADEGEQLPNIREIRIEGLEQNWLDMGCSFDVEQIRLKSVMERFTRLIYAGTTNVDLLLGDAQMQRLLRSGEKFELLVVDLFLSDALLGLSHYYKIPTVVVSPAGPNSWLNEMMGNPQNSALDPSNFLPFSERMTLWERSINTLMALFEKLTYNFFHVISQQAIYQRHFEPLCEAPLPHHRELTQNLSLVLLNSHPLLQYPRAYLPNMLEIGGAHLSVADSQEQQLPQHLAAYISDAPEGVIYISMGANLRTADLSRDKLDALLHVFESMPRLRFLLKWELQPLDFELPENVYISEWFPQQAVLAHPNVKLFVSSAGLMSVQEAIATETPLLAIPIYAEQEVLARRLQQQHCAELVSYDNLSYDELLYALQKLLRNLNDYQSHIQQMHQLLLLNSGGAAAATRALQHIELVLQSKGATHLQSHANELGFFRTQLLDVLLILLAGVGCIIAVPFLVTCCILRKSYHSYLLNATNYASTLRAHKVTDSGAGDQLQLQRRRQQQKLPPQQRISTSSSDSLSSSSSSSGSPPGALQKRCTAAAAAASLLQSTEQSDA